jgi:CheY-like chemotaxis protein
MDERRILLVDDNPSDLLIFQEAFRYEMPGIHIDTAESPVDASDQITHALTKHRCHTIMLLDATWPDGIPAVLLGMIRTDPIAKAMHVVVMSSDINPTARKAYRSCGVHHYLTKPDDWKGYCTLARLVSTSHLYVGKYSPWGTLSLPDDAVSSHG